MTENLPTTTKTDVPDEFVQVATICAATEVVIGGRTVMGIADARDLHAGLGVGRDYTNWIKARIAKFAFKEGADFEVISLAKSGEQDSCAQHGGHNASIYRLTLDMAKELAMVENNEAGRTVRRYFIWAEEKARRGMALTASQVGGIAKAVLNKALAEKLAPIMERMEQALRGFDPSRAVVVEYKPMLAAIEEEGVPAKKRRSLVQRCSRRCQKWLTALNQGGDVRISQETGRYLFHVVALQAWMRAEGRGIIRAHMDKLNGQGVLSLVKGGKDDA